MSDYQAFVSFGKNIIQTVYGLKEIIDNLDSSSISFTKEQQDAINSGITLGLVDQFKEALPTAEQLAAMNSGITEAILTALINKQTNLMTDEVYGTLSVSKGGTSASDASGARRNLEITPENIGAAEKIHVHELSDLSDGILPIHNGGTGNAVGNAFSASVLETPRNIRIDLSSITPGIFDGSSDITPGVTGILPILRGGTNANNATQARINLGITPEIIGAALIDHTHSLGEILADGGTGIVPIAAGGTGATTPEEARTNIGAAASSHNHNTSNINAGRLISSRLPTSGTANRVLKVAGANTDPIYSQISLTTDVSEILPVENGGTGANTVTGALTNLEALPLAGGTMTGPINRSCGGSWINANRGQAVIVSTAGAAEMAALYKRDSTNGVFTIYGYRDYVGVQYTAKATIDAGTNAVTKEVSILNEAGNTTFPGTITAANIAVSTTQAALAALPNI